MSNMVDKKGRLISVSDLSCPSMTRNQSDELCEDLLQEFITSGSKGMANFLWQAIQKVQIKPEQEAVLRTVRSFRPFLRAVVEADEALEQTEKPHIRPPLHADGNGDEEGQCPMI